MADQSPLAFATAKLRALALSRDDGTLLGSEGDVLAALGVSRATLKQAARSLEREGLIRVKRGVSGGYYSARPTEATLKTIVSAYLETIDVDLNDVVSVTTILWLEVVRRASATRSAGMAESLTALIRDLERLPADASFSAVDAIEQASRRAIFAFVDCRYIELIMRINQAFGGRDLLPLSTQDEKSGHLPFVAAWRKAKALELQAIVDGDGALADIAAQNARASWNRRVIGPDPSA